MRSQTSIVIELKNRRYITGCISCMPLIVTVKKLLNVLGQTSLYWAGEKKF
jgi:hypothetical protein